MESDYDEIIAKIDKAIITHGIPHYINKWRKIDIPENFDSYDDFLNFLKEYVKAYHYHSFVKSLKQQSEYAIQSRKEHMEKEENGYLPEFKWDTKNKIGTIKFYHFYNGLDEKKNNDAINNITNIVVTNFNDWINKDINGLIIDLREHKGGNMWAHIPSLKNILGNTTLLSFTNIQVTHKDKKWINMRDGEIFHNEEFMSRELKFKKPIAVLVSKNTASSGEFITGIFYKRDNVRMFGDKTKETAGYFSANCGFKITDDIVLFSTIVLCETTDGILHTDEILHVDQKTNNPMTDAKKWIMKEIL